MSIRAKQRDQMEFKKVPPGASIGIINLVCYLGFQEVTYKSESKSVEQLAYRFEFPEHRLEWEKDGKQQEGPMVLTQVYTLSMHPESNLRKMLVNWRGRDFTLAEEHEFDFGCVLGKAGIVTIVHREGRNGKVWANISAVSPLMKGMAVPAAELPLIVYDDNDNEENLSLLPQWMQDKIGNQITGEEWQKPLRPEKTGNVVVDADDDPPF